ncbi:hypothetical protein M758_8G055200 [Ceratodon purpureus]|nr:hypothetical protein M758_8G055200 [Ceratodon purpureus]
MVGMDAALWSRLPAEVLEQVLPFLPVRDVCRCSAVCKRWKLLISTPDFGTLCYRNSQALGRCYIISRYLVKPYDIEWSDKMNYYDTRRTSYEFGWSILDLETKRWYTFKQMERSFYYYNYPSSGFVAASGGFVCEVTSGEQVMYVHNPLSRSRRELINMSIPSHRTTNRYYGMTTLVVDESAASYQIFFIHKNFRGYREPTPDSDDSNQDIEDDDCVVTCMNIYETTTLQWRSATNPPLEPGLGVGSDGSSIMFQGRLYVVLSSYEHSHYWLFTNNITEDEWEDTNVYLDPQRMAVSPQLIVSDNRLFIMSFEATEEAGRRLYVEEILLAERVLSTMLQMTEEHVRLLFHFAEDVDDDDGNSSQSSEENDPEIEAFGFGKSIMLLSTENGISTVYDLESRLWSEMPRHPMDPSSPRCELWYATTAITLRPPSTN